MIVDGYLLTGVNYTSAFPYSAVQPSTQFNTCQNCTTLYPNITGRCDQCQSYNTTYCDSCYDFIGSNLPASTPGCKLCNTNLTNCIQCNITNSSLCLNCADGYFLNNKTNSCSQCNSTQGCLRCNSTGSGQCLECQKGYVYNSTSFQCDRCQSTMSSNIQQYGIIDYRCTQCQFSGPNNVESCAYCDVGYMNSTDTTEGGIIGATNQTCKLKCGQHQYPQVLFAAETSLTQNKNIISSTLCMECPNQCIRCIGPNSATQCTQCNDTQVLKITDPLRQAGTCINKIAAPTNSPNPYNIYVANSLGSYNVNLSLRNGSLSAPFIDLSDALVRAKEVASQYTTVINITINMFTGMHYLLRNRGDPSQIYTPQNFYDPSNLNYQLTIQPVLCNSALGINAPICGNNATIINKRRETFVVDIPVSLTVKNITIDSLDSILPSSTTCLNMNKTCCQVNINGSISNADPTDLVTNCAQAFQNLNLNQDCYMNQPRTMFRMLVNTRGDLTKPNQFLLQSSTVMNIFYDMNSLVNMTQYGGNVTLLNSTFKRISMCGSLIKNFYTSVPLADFSKITNTAILSQYQQSLITKMQGIQSSYVNSQQASNFPAMTSQFACQATQTCFNLAFSNCTFNNIPFGTNPQSTMNMISASNGLRYQGSIVNVVNFQGLIRIQDSIFTDNQFTYNGCISGITANPIASSSINNFNQLYNPSSQYNLYQIKALISVIGQNKPLFIYNNTFVRNVGLKGIVSIEIDQQTAFPLMIAGNTFINNSALVESNVLNIRKKNPVNLLGTSFTQSSQLTCGGIQISGNSFISNIGCSGTTGAMKVYCYDNSASQPSSIIQPVSSYDSQNFIGNSGDQSLLSFSISSINFVYYSDVYTPANSIFQSKTFQINLQILNLTGNTFQMNFAGANSSIVSIEGFPIIYQSSESYVGNMNYFENAYIDYSPLYQLQVSQSTPVNQITISQAMIDAYPSQANSIQKVVRVVYFSVSQSTFDNNCIFQSSTGQSDNYPQASAILIIDSYGTMEFTQSTVFQNYQGITNAEYFQVTTMYFASDIVTGLMTDLVKLFRSNFNSLILNIDTQNNQLQLGNAYISIFTFSQMSISIPDQVPVIQNINASGLAIQNNFTLFKLDMMNYTLKNSIITNLILSLQTGGGRLLSSRIQVSPQGYSNVTFQNLTMSEISTAGESWIVIDQSQAMSAPAKQILNLLSLTFDTCTLLDITSDTSIIRVAGLSQASLLLNQGLDISVQNSTLSNINLQSNSGVIQIDSQNISSTQSLELLINVSNTYFVNSQAFFVNVLDQTFQSQSAVSYQMVMSNNTFINQTTTLFNHGLLNISSNGLSAITNFSFVGQTVSNLTSGNFISFSEVAVNNAKAYTESISISNSSFGMISDAILALGDRSYYGVQNSLVRNIFINESSFPSIDSEIFLFGNVYSWNCTSFYTDANVIMNSNISNFLTTPGSSYFNFGSQNITFSGDIQSSMLILNSLIFLTQRSNSIMLLPLTQMTSIGSISRNISVINSTFTNISQGSALVFGPITVAAGNQYIEVYSIAQSSFKQLGNGAGISFDSTNLSAKSGTIISQTSIQNSLFYNFSSQPVLSLGTYLFISSALSSSSKSVIVTNSSFANVNSSCILNPQITGQTYLNQAYYTEISNSSFDNALNSTLLVEKGNITSLLGGVSQAVNISQSTFTNMKNLPIIVKKGVSSSFTSSKQQVFIFQSKFENLTKGAIIVESSAYALSAIANRNISIQDSSFNNLQSTAIQIGSMNFTQASLMVVQDLQFFNTNQFKNISATVVSSNGFLMNQSVASINQTWSFMNSSVNSAGAINALQFTNTTLLATGSLISAISISSSNFTGQSNNAIYIGQGQYSSNGVIQVSLGVIGSNFISNLNSAITVFGAIISGGIQSSQNLTVASSVFQNISNYAIIADQIVSTSSLKSISGVNITNCTFQNLGNAALLLNSNSGFSNTSSDLSRETYAINSIFTNVSTSPSLILQSQTIQGSGSISDLLLIQSCQFFQNYNSSLVVLPQIYNTLGSVYLTYTLSQSSFIPVATAPINIGSFQIISISSVAYNFSVIGSNFSNIAHKTSVAQTGSVINFNPIVIQAQNGIQMLTNLVSSNFLNISLISPAILYSFLNLSTNGSIINNITMRSVLVSNINGSFFQMPIRILTSLASINETFIIDNSSFSNLKYGDCINFGTSTISTQSSKGSYNFDTHLANSSFTSINGRALAISDLSQSINIGGAYKNKISLNSVTFNSINGTTIDIAVTNAQISGSSNDQIAINNVSMTRINGSAISFGNRLLNSTLNQTLNVTIIQASFKNFISPQAVFQYNNLSLIAQNGPINMSVSFSNSNFTSISGSGSAFLLTNLGIQSLSNSINEYFSFASCLFQTFTSVSQNSVIFINEVGSFAQNSRSLILSLSGATAFSNIAIGSAITLNEFGIVAQQGSFMSTVNVANTNFTAFSSGSAISINRYSITAEQGYQTTLTVTTAYFTNLQTQNLNIGVIDVLAEYIKANSISKSVTVSSVSFQSISVGPSFQMYATNLVSSNFITNVASFTGFTLSQSTTNAMASLLFLEDTFSGGSIVSQLTVLNGVFTNNVGSQSTSCIYADDQGQNQIQVTIGSTTFTNNKGIVTSDIHFNTMNTLSLTGITWVSNYESATPKARFLYRELLRYQLSVKSSLFNCSDVGMDKNNLFIPGFAAQIVNRVAVFVLIGGSYIDPTALFNTNINVDQFSSNLYSNCQESYKGGIFYLQQGAQLFDTNSQYQYNNAFYGGVAYVTGSSTSLTIDTPSQWISYNVAYYGALVYAQENANVTIQNAKISSNQAVEGAIVFLTDNSFLSFGPVTAESNTAYKRGMIVAYLGSSFAIQNAMINLNVAYYDSVFIYISNTQNQVYATGGFIGMGLTIYSVGVYSSIDSTTIQENTVVNGGRIITVLDGSLYINNTKFQKNLIYQDTLGVHVAMGNLTLENTIFINQQGATYYTAINNPYLGDINGAFVSIEGNSTVTVLDTSFFGGRGTYGGCINMQGSSTLYIENSEFTSCVATLGGAIYAVNFYSLVVVNSVFTSNIVFRGFSQNIYAQSCKVNMTLTNNIFTSYHNSIYFRDGVLLEMQDNSFSPESLRVPTIPLQEYAGGLYIMNAQQIQFSGVNSFQNLTGGMGGAIYISLDLNFKNLNYKLSYVLDGLQILYCTSTSDGGGLYLNNVQNMIINGATITNNNALFGQGGGILFQCNKTVNYQCSLNINQGSRIESNQAEIGGGIRWNWVKPIVDKTSKVSGNSASLYGNDYASFAREIVLFDDESDYLRYFNKVNYTSVKLNESSALTSYIYDSIQSGGYIPPRYFALIDDEMQVVTTNSGSEIDFNILALTIGIFTTQVIGVTKFFSAFGVYNVSGMQIECAPNSTQYMTMQIVDAVDLSIPSNQLYLTQQFGKVNAQLKNFTNYSIPLTLSVRSCIPGEGLKPDGTCFQCPSGTYLLVEPQPGVPTQCKSCPTDKAICLGGTKIGPLPDFWRKSNATDDFIPCPLKFTCLGMIEPDMNPVGDCTDGFYGALCSSCMPGYARSGKYDCGICPSEFKNLARSISILVLVIVVVGLLVRTTIAGATRKDTQSVYTKILMNHLQLLAICASFNFKWPSAVTSFFNVGSQVMAVSDVLVSYDCEMDRRNPASIDRYDMVAGPTEMRVYYMKMMMMGCIPLVVIGLVVTFWWILLSCQRRIELLETKLIASLVIIFFLVHPRITQQMIAMFDCQTYDGDLRLVGDLEVVCWEGLHTLMALGVALPFLIVWGLGIPGAVWILMIRDRERLDTLAVKEKFGFLYRGYKRSSFYWEIIIMYRKILMLGIAVFMNRSGLVVQALVLLLMLVTFLQTNNMRRPFVSRSLNDLEDISLITGIITIYCGIFFITTADPNSSSYNPDTDFFLPPAGSLVLFSIIILANVAFVIVWVVKFTAVIRAMIKDKYQWLYIIVFLCCREDKLEREVEFLAREAKREGIIEKIEEMQFFFKHMKSMYERTANYEGHERFLRILYYIEQEKGNIDLTEKKHNFSVSGKMARERKLDPQRLKEILDEHMLNVDKNFLGEQSQESEHPKGPGHKYKSDKLVKIRDEVHVDLKNKNSTPVLRFYDPDRNLIEEKASDISIPNYNDDTRVNLKYIQDETSYEDHNSGRGHGKLFELNSNDHNKAHSLFEDFVPQDLKRKAKALQEQDEEGEGQKRTRNMAPQLKKHRKKKILSEAALDQPSVANANQFYQSESDYNYSDQSIKNLRIMRGLTNKMNQKKDDQKLVIQKQQDDTQPEVHKSKIEQRIFNPAMTNVTNKSDLVKEDEERKNASSLLKQFTSHTEEIKARSKPQFQSGKNRLVSITEIMQLTKTGKEWRDDITFDGRAKLDEANEKKQKKEKKKNHPYSSGSDQLEITLGDFIEDTT